DDLKGCRAPSGRKAFGRRKANHSVGENDGEKGGASTGALVASAAAGGCPSRCEASQAKSRDIRERGQGDLRITDLLRLFSQRLILQRVWRPHPWKPVWLQGA